MRIALAGLGTTGSHLARQLRDPDITEIRLFDIDQQRIRAVRGALDVRVSPRSGAPDPEDPPDVTVLATPAGGHVQLAAKMLEAGSHVVSISDDPDEVVGLLALDGLARSVDRSLVVGAGFCPGLSSLLVRFAADQLDLVEGISVSRAGTAGPACARQHHRALKHDGRDWRDGRWELRRGGSGRDLAWFPEPIGARDCYRGALPSPILLQRRYPEARRISARMAATRRDRLTGRLPMLRKPHRDGGPGGIRVEVRGRAGGAGPTAAVETLVYGVMDHPSVAAATVAAVVATRTARGQGPPGADGLVAWAEPGELLSELARRGIQIAAFSGQLDPAPTGQTPA
ncbi:MAG: Gfo/Idh/MocA family oxidoreductase [Actinomycetota bacterium]